METMFYTSFYQSEISNFLLRYLCSGRTVYQILAVESAFSFFHDFYFIQGTNGEWDFTAYFMKIPFPCEPGGVIEKEYFGSM